MITRPDPAAPRPRAAATAAAPLRQTAREAAATTTPEHGRRNLALVLFGGLAIIAIAALLITQVFNGSDTPAKKSPNRVLAPGQSTTKTAGAVPALTRSAITIGVLNGSGVDGLARGARARLTERGYPDAGKTQNAAQSSATTSVYYAKGSNRPARDVARILGFDVAVVKPLTPTIQSEGGGAAVIVLIGLDQAK